MARAATVTWEDVQTALNSLAKSTGLVEDVQAEIFARAQKYSESVTKFGDEMLKLLQELTKAYISELAVGEVMTSSATASNERQAIRSFEMGLQNEQLRMMVVLSKPTTLYEAFNSATKYEHMVSRKKPPPQASSGTSSSSTPAPSTSPKPTCQNCHKVDHTISNCFKPKVIKPAPRFCVITASSRAT